MKSTCRKCTPKTNSRPFLILVNNPVAFVLVVKIFYVMKLTFYQREIFYEKEFIDGLELVSDKDSDLSSDED